MSPYVIIVNNYYFYFHHKEQSLQGHYDLWIGSSSYKKTVYMLLKTKQIPFLGAQCHVKSLQGNGTGRFSPSEIHLH